MGSALQAMDVAPLDQQNLNMKLRSAARNGNKQKVERLIAQGADINAQNKSGEFALMRAAENGRRDICELLITQGADVNAQSYKTKDTALMKAAFMGHKEICQLLIAHGANMYVQNIYGDTALMKAAKSNEKTICKFLIDEMIKQEQKLARTVFYNSLKEHTTTGRDMAKMVTQQLQDSQQKSKTGYKSRAREEIMKINVPKLKYRLLRYLDRL